MTKDVLIRSYPFIDIKPVVCGEEKCDKGHAFGPAIREFYLLHFVLSGKGIFKSSRGIFNVSKGEIFIIKPYEITYYEADQEEPWHYCWIGFETSLKIHGLLEKDKLSLYQAEHLFRAMVECNAIKEGREFYLCSKLYELLSHLEQQSIFKTDQQQVYIDQIINYIHAHYMKPLTIEGLAEMVGLDRSHFSRIFKIYCEKSPQQYLVDYRLEKSAELISVYHYTPTQAASSVGYQDYFNFSKMFKKRYGVSPINYKNR